MLWYLHLCADSKIVVTDYVDQSSGTLMEQPNGGGHFTEVVLRPLVTLPKGADAAFAEKLHERAHRLCFIANSVNFSVHCEPTIQISSGMT